MVYKMRWTLIQGIKEVCALSALLEVKDLTVSLKSHGGEVQAVRGVDFVVNEGEVLSIVGESGCGKSVTAQTIMGLLPKKLIKRQSGSIRFQGQELMGLSRSQLRKYKGAQMSMVFQDPMTSLNPTMKIGHQIIEGIVKHQKLSKKVAKQKAIELLHLVGIPHPEERYRQYPHELSGGMRQRVLIAIALSCHPKLIIADEPTTALDVTVQAQILDILKDLKTRLKTSIILITHDLGVVAEIAQRVIVMYAGKVVEKGTVEDILEHPNHPYTKALLSSLPRTDAKEKIRLKPIEGTPPDLYSPPKGCPFAPRCDNAMEICLQGMPKETRLSDSHISHCWLNDERCPSLKERLMLLNAEEGRKQA